MHDYLRAVGFSKVQHKRDLQRLLDMVMGSPDSEFASSCGGGSVMSTIFRIIQVIRFLLQMISVLKRFLREKSMTVFVMW